MQIRRRRECAKCASRFNTYEAPELVAPRVIKKGGLREAFSEEKLRRGMLKALEKFPGKTVTYVNNEAISAGALISAGTDEIYFAPFESLAGEPYHRAQLSFETSSLASSLA